MHHLDHNRVKYQLTVAKLPLAKDVEDFLFKDTPINEALVRDLAAGGFIIQQRNVVLEGVMYFSADIVQ